MSEQPSEQGEIDVLRTATERLAEQVSTLSLALKTVNTLQVRQQEIDDKASHAVALAETTKRDVSENAVSKHELANVVSSAEARQMLQRALTQRRLRIFAISASVTAVLISLAAAALAYVVNNDAIRRQQSSRHDFCVSQNQQRVEGAKRSHEYFTPKLAELDAEPHPDPVLKSILQALASQQPQLAKCPPKP